MPENNTQAPDQGAQGARSPEDQSHIDTLTAKNDELSKRTVQLENELAELRREKSAHGARSPESPSVPESYTNVRGEEVKFDQSTPPGVRNARIAHEERLKSGKGGGPVMDGRSIG